MLRNIAIRDLWLCLLQYLRIFESVRHIFFCALIDKLIKVNMTGTDLSDLHFRPRIRYPLPQDTTVERFSQYAHG
jgi:hypothetical protein